MPSPLRDRAHYALIKTLKAKPKCRRCGSIVERAGVTCDWCLGLVEPAQITVDLFRRRVKTPPPKQSKARFSPEERKKFFSELGKINSRKVWDNPETRAKLVRRQIELGYRRYENTHWRIQESCGTIRKTCLINRRKTVLTSKKGRGFGNRGKVEISLVAQKENPWRNMPDNILKGWQTKREMSGSQVFPKRKYGKWERGLRRKISK